MYFLNLQSNQFDTKNRLTEKFLSSPNLKLPLIRSTSGSQHFSTPQPSTKMKIYQPFSSLNLNGLSSLNLNGSISSSNSSTNVFKTIDICKENTPRKSLFKQERDTKEDKTVYNGKQRGLLDKLSSYQALKVSIVKGRTEEAKSSRGMKVVSGVYQSAKERINKKISLSKRWDVVKGAVNIISFFNTLRAVTRNGKRLSKNPNNSCEVLKKNIKEVARFMYSKLDPLKEMIGTNFITYDLNINPTSSHYKESFSRIKTFINELFSIFSNLTNIPENIKYILKSYVSDKAILPSGFLSSLEYNRLEFNLKLQLVNMTTEKKTMLLTYFIYYRILILEIFENITEYYRGSNHMNGGLASPKKKRNKSVGFLEIANLRVVINGAAEIEIPNGAPKVVSKYSQKILKGILKMPTPVVDIKSNILKNNFQIISQVLDSILRITFLDVPKVCDHFKEKHILKHFVINKNNIGDDVEYIDGLFTGRDIKIFESKNTTWINMYKTNLISFSIQLLESIL
jgi:hypothetical protein